MVVDNDEFDCFDECFSSDLAMMDSFDPDDILLDSNNFDLHLAKKGKNPSCNQRRLSLLSFTDNNRDHGDLIPEDMPFNEYKECFEHFSSNGEHKISPDLRVTTEPQIVDASSDEFKRTFRQTLSKLEQSMRRSEQSRKMLGDQRSVYSNSAGVHNAVDWSYSKGRSHLLSYMVHLRGNATI